MSGLTWNQRRALERLSERQGGSSPREIAEPFRYFAPYLCGSGARSALMALVRKGLAEVASAGSPIRYRITEAGRAALEPADD